MSSPLISRMSGAGNTFFFWNLVEHPVPREARSGVTRFLCDSFTNFFTDGMVFIDKDSQGQVDFEWDFYNSDGSTAEMCGNAARCATLYFHERMKGGERCRFRTTAGIIEGAVNGNSVEVMMPELKDEGAFLSIRLNKRDEEFFFVNTGVPHLVVEGQPDEELAKFLRRAPELGEAGANVTFFNEISPGEAEAITYERGVENFTMACGTGAVAAAVFSKQKNPVLKTHGIEMPGGSLRVDFQTALQPKLNGPTQFEFDLVFKEGIL